MCMVMLDFICIGSTKLFGPDRERKIQNEKYMSPAGFEPTPRHSTARLRRLDDDLWFNVLQDSGIQINKNVTWQHVSNWLW